MIVRSLYHVISEFTDHMGTHFDSHGWTRSHSNSSEVAQPCGLTQLPAGAKTVANIYG